MGCTGLVVALEDVLNEVTERKAFDVASVVSRGIVIMGSEWIDAKRTTLRVRPCVSSALPLCVFR